MGLDSLSANLDRANYASAYAEDNQRSITRRVESKYRVSDFSGEHFDVTGNLFLRVEASGFKDPILAIDIVITGHFHSKTPKTKVSRAEADRFAAEEARLILWPYFRQLVSDTSGRMHIGTITLPLAVS